MGKFQQQVPMKLVKRALSHWLKGHFEKFESCAFVKAQHSRSSVKRFSDTKWAYQNGKKQQENTSADLAPLIQTLLSISIVWLIVEVGYRGQFYGHHLKLLWRPPRKLLSGLNNTKITFFSKLGQKPVSAAILGPSIKMAFWPPGLSLRYSPGSKN